MADEKDYDYDLGLASSTGGGTPSLGLAGGGDAGDLAVAEQVGLRPGSSGMLSAPSADAAPDLGFASARTQSDQEYLQNLPTMAKVGLALQSFSAGMAGRANPIETLLKERRAQMAADRADLATTITTIQKGTEVLRKMPPGIARDAVAKELGRAVGGGEIAKVFEAAGDQHQEIKEVLSTFSDPDVQGQLLKSCSGSQDFRACVMTQARDKDFMDRAHSMADSKRMPDVVKKLSATMDQAKASGLLDAYKGEDGKFDVPFAKLVELNDKAKIFTPEEMDTIRRNEGMLSPYGIKTTKAIEAGAAERAKIAERPTKEDFKEGATRRIFDKAGTELQQEFKGGQWVTIGQKREKATDKPLTLAQEAADERVLKARQDIAGMDKAEMIKKREKELPNGKPNPDYDPDVARNWRVAQQPLFADVKAKRDDKKAPKPAEGGDAPKPKPDAAKPAGDSFNLASWELTKKKHGLTDAELEKRLGRKKPTQ